MSECLFPRPKEIHQNVVSLHPVCLVCDFLSLDPYQYSGILLWANTEIWMRNVLVGSHIWRFDDQLVGPVWEHCHQTFRTWNLAGGRIPEGHTCRVCSLALLPVLSLHPVCEWECHPLASSFCHCVVFACWHNIPRVVESSPLEVKINRFFLTLLSIIVFYHTNTQGTNPESVVHFLTAVTPNTHCSYQFRWSRITGETGFWAHL